MGAGACFGTIGRGLRCAGESRTPPSSTGPVITAANKNAPTNTPNSAFSFALPTIRVPKTVTSCSHTLAMPIAAAAVVMLMRTMQRMRTTTETRLVDFPFLTGRFFTCGSGASKLGAARVSTGARLGSMRGDLSPPFAGDGAAAAAFNPELLKMMNSELVPFSAS